MPRVDESPDARDVTADVDVVGSLLDTRVDQGVALQAEGPGHVQDDVRACGQRAESLLVFAIGDDQGTRYAKLLELLRVASGDCPPHSVRRVLDQVFGGLAAGEAGRPVDHQVELSGHEVSAA